MDHDITAYLRLQFVIGQMSSSVSSPGHSSPPLDGSGLSHLRVRFFSPWSQNCVSLQADHGLQVPHLPLT